MATATKSFSNVTLVSTYYGYRYPRFSTPATGVSVPNTDQSPTLSFTKTALGIPAGAVIQSAVLTFGLNSPAHATNIRDITFNGARSGPVNSGFSMMPLLDSNSFYFRFKSGTAYTNYPDSYPPKGFVNSVLNSGAITFSSLLLTVTYTLPYTACTPPTTLSTPTGFANPGGTTRLSWSGQQAGTGNPITGYKVYRAGAPDGTYSLLGTTEDDYYDVPCPTPQGNVNYFKVRTLGTVEGYDSEISSAYEAVTANSLPAAPAVTGNGRTTYNSKPRVLLIVGADADGHTQAIAATGYTASSTGQLAVGKKIVLRRTNTLAAPGALSFEATPTDQMGGVGSPGSAAMTYAAATFTDALSAGVTPIKAVHMTELRTMVDNVRLFYGMAAYSWARAITPGVTGLAGWKDDVLELRAAIDEIISRVNGWDTANATGDITTPSWIAIPTNTPSTAVMDQLRAVIPTL